MNLMSQSVYNIGKQWWIKMGLQGELVIPPPPKNPQKNFKKKVLILAVEFFLP